MYYELVSPIYAHELARYRKDSRLSLAGYKFRRALRLGLLVPNSFAMYTPMLMIGTYLATQATV